MRIVAGEYKGRVIKMPRGVGVRPTQDRVREAIFNIIREVVPGSKVLDLYAGSGGFGIEALSRGADSIIFVDNNNICVKMIKSNLSLLGVSGKSTQVYTNDGLKAIERLERDGAKLDIIFLDPPYYRDSFDKLRTTRRSNASAGSMAKNTLIKIEACDILSPHGFAVAEHFVKDDMPEAFGSLKLFKQNKYGDTVISFYRKAK